jgi:hypothetical protein
MRLAMKSIFDLIGERKMKENQEEKITNLDIRKMIGDAFEDLLYGKTDYQRMTFSYGWSLDTKSKFFRTLEKAIDDCAEKIERKAWEIAERTAKAEIQKKIYTEEFIDEVVARIKSKQIK